MNDETREEQEPLEASFEDAPPMAGALARTEQEFEKAQEEVRFRVRMFNLLRKHSLEMCYHTDWSIQADAEGDDPEVYLEGSGARRLAHAYGISWTDVQEEKSVESDAKGEYALVTVKGMVHFRGRSCQEMGMAESRAPFLTKGGRINYEDVSIPNLHKKAWTDFVRRAVTNTLGLEAIPLSELPDAYRSKVGRIGRGRGTQGGRTQTQDETQLATRIWNGCLKMSEGPEVAALLLKQLSSFKGDDGAEKFVDGPEALRRISKGWLGSIWGKVKREWDAFQEQNRAPYSLDDLKAEEALVDAGEGDQSPGADPETGEVTE